MTENETFPVGFITRDFTFTHWNGDIINVQKNYAVLISDCDMGHKLIRPTSPQLFQLERKINGAKIAHPMWLRVSNDLISISLSQTDELPSGGY